MQRYSLAVGDIVFARTGATTGKSFLIRECPDAAVFASYLIRVRPSRKLEPVYLSYYFRTPEYWRQIGSSSNGSTQPGVNASKLGQLSIPLPPLPEQKRIAAILDKADAIRRRRREALCLAEQFVPSLFHEMFGDPSTNQKGWEQASVSDFVREFQGGKNIATDDRPSNHTKHFILKVSAVTWGDYRPHECKPVPPSFDPPPEYFVRPGDLLISRANTSELVGATVYVMDTPENMILPDKIWRFVWKQPRIADPLFVHALFHHPVVQGEIGRRATGTSGSMKNISMPKLLSMRVPLPPLELQEQFAHRVRLQGVIWDGLRARLAHYDTLFNSLVSRAFRGEL